MWTETDREQNPGDRFRGQEGQIGGEDRRWCQRLGPAPLPQETLEELSTSSYVSVLEAALVVLASAPADGGEQRHPGDAWNVSVLNLRPQPPGTIIYIQLQGQTCC